MWSSEATEIVRVLMNDMSASPTYSDDTLLRLILVAARQVSLELTFSQAFVVDIVAQTITPDPTDIATPDESFMNLIALKAACLLDRGAAILATKQGIAVKDGSSSIDLKGNMMGRLKLLEKGYCAAYLDAKLEYQSGQFGVAGAAVMTPFRLYAFGGEHRSRDIFY